MPLMRTIHAISAESIGPFMESGRLTGTPKDTATEPPDFRVRCWGCQGLFAIDELSDGWYCEECEGKKK
jgi:hypothetical protein